MWVCIVLVVVCRHNQRCSRGHDRGWRQPRRDPRVRQTVQDTTAVARPDADAGRPGTQRHRRTVVQPVSHLPVSSTTQRLIISVSPAAVSRWGREVRGDRPPNLAVLLTHCGQSTRRKLVNLMPPDVRF